MVRAFLLFGWLLAAALTSALLALGDDLSATGSVVLWDFEDASDLEGWDAPGGELALAEGRGVGGSMALGVTIVTAQLQGTARLSHSVKVIPGSSYEFSGEYVDADGDIDRVLVALALRDGEGQFIDADTDDMLYAPRAWSVSFLAPCDAVTGRIEVLVMGADGSTVYLDDIRLKGSSPETACPSPTPSPTLSPTPTPTDSPTPTPSPSPTPTPSRTATRTATLPPTITATPASTMPAASTRTPTAPPPTASPTPSPTLSPTPTATDSPTPTPSATPTPTDSPTPTPSPSPTPTPSRTATRTATLPPTITATPSSTTPATPTSTPTAPPPTAPPTPSHGLLVNGGFEAADEGEPVGWQTYGGVLRHVVSPVRSGRFAGGFYSSTGSTKWAYQTVAVEPGAWNELEGWVYQDDPWVETALLRISWYVSGDGSGSAVATVDSTDELAEPVGRFRRLSTGPVRAPPGVRSAKARVVLRPRGEASALIYLDDVSFRPAAAPPTSTPARTPTPTFTLTPAPTPTFTPTYPSPPTPTPTTTPAASSLQPPVTPSPSAGLPPTPPPTPSPSPAASFTPTASTWPTGTPASTSTPTAPPPPTAPPTPSHGLLVNGGFEAADDGEPVGWQTYGGVLRQVVSPVRSGRFAGGFYSSTGSTKWAYQTMLVEPTAWYELEGWVYQDDPWVETALLRISWYVSGDGSGSAVATVDSTDELAEPVGRFRRLSTGPVRAPPGVHSAKARVVLRPRGEVSALIYLDDVSFRPAAAPPVPPEPVAQEPAGEGSASVARLRPASVVGSGDRTASDVLAAHQGSETPSFTPMPLPVIRRNSLLVPLDEPSSTGETPWWPWALVAGAMGAAAAGWGMWWAQRPRRNERNND